MKKCKECGREETGYGSLLDEDGYCFTCGVKHSKEKIKRLQEQLKEANEVIESRRTYDFTVDDENAEYYQVKWNVKAKRFYKNRKWGVK